MDKTTLIPEQDNSSSISTDNLTTEFRHDPVNKFTEPRWIAGEVMLLLITLVTVYIFVALAYYSWRFRHMPQVSGCGQEMRERYLHYSCAAVIFIAIARCVLHQIVAFLPINDADDLTLCRSMMVSGRIVYTMAICLTYVHLWLRQYMFYSRDELKKLRTRAQRFVNWAVLFLIVCTSTVIAIVTFVPLAGERALTTYHDDKCNAFEYNNKTSLFVYAGLSLFYQATLVMLFIYPIIKQRSNEKQGNGKTSTGIGYPDLWRGIRRGFILTVVVIATDATFAVIVWFLTRNHPEFLSSIIALNDINLLINVICCICTFRNWRKIVLGFPVCRDRGWDNVANWRLAANHSQKHRVSQESNAELHEHTEKTSVLYDNVDPRYSIPNNDAVWHVHVEV